MGENNLSNTNKKFWTDVQDADWDGLDQNVEIDWDTIEGAVILREKRTNKKKLIKLNEWLFLTNKPDNCYC